ncbi:unnamed protein product [Rhizophagus irregularis]|nr:unnamed protein product [Rhizophagus irregularis]
MSILNNRTQVPMESELSDSDIGLNHKNCSIVTNRLLKNYGNTIIQENMEQWLEWVPFDRFTNIEQIGEGGFSKVYSATWIDGKAD